MATTVDTISLPHGTIPTQMFGNVNLQNAIMYVNENFSAVVDGVNDAANATNEALAEKADADHDHDEAYAALSHTHAQSEITGLQSALDDKAALNHEHSQYLSSLPTHYHATSDVQGLDERLQAKAEKVHTHAMSDVEGLTTKLGVLASTSYVDQQISSVGSSIKTIADQEVESYAADKGDASTEGKIPKDVVAAPSNESTSDKNARVGTSTEYARADHKHVYGYDGGSTAPTSDKVLMCKANQTGGATDVTWEDAVSPAGVSGGFIDGANITSDSSGDPRLNYAGTTSSPLDITRLTNLRTTWVVGTEDESGNKIGVKLTVCTGIIRLPSSSSGNYYAHFSNLYFDKNGLLVKVETAQNYYQT